MKGKLKDLTRNLDGTWSLTLTLGGEIRQVWDKLKDKDVNVEIKKYREKRSLDANAYCWVLIDKIAEKMRIDKAEVYREAIRGIGGVSTTVCVQNEALESLRNHWSSHGIGWQTETMKSKTPGCTNVTLFYGSSEYDTNQMSLLIDHIVQDAKALGMLLRGDRGDYRQC